MAELAGVAVFLVIGTGIDCQVVLSTLPVLLTARLSTSIFKSNISGRVTFTTPREKRSGSSYLLGGLN